MRSRSRELGLVIRDEDGGGEAARLVEEHAVGHAFRHRSSDP
jgi:hypothetical protein